MAKKTSKAKMPMTEKSMRDCPQMVKQGPGGEMSGEMNAGKIKKGKKGKKGMMRKG